MLKYAVVFSLLTTFVYSKNIAKYHFTLLESKEVPEIFLTFPDGSKDSLELDHNDRAEDCAYFGHFRNRANKACIAVTGCPGVEPLLITISARKGLAMFELGLDGITKQLSKVGKCTSILHLSHYLTYFTKGRIECEGR